MFYLIAEVGIIALAAKQIERLVHQHCVLFACRVDSLDLCCGVTQQGFCQPNALRACSDGSFCTSHRRRASQCGPCSCAAQPFCDPTQCLFSSSSAICTAFSAAPFLI